MKIKYLSMEKIHKPNFDFFKDLQDSKLHRMQGKGYVNEALIKWFQAARAKKEKHPKPSDTNIFPQVMVCCRNFVTIKIYLFKSICREAAEVYNKLCKSWKILFSLIIGSYENQNIYKRVKWKFSLAHALLPKKNF